MLRRPDEALRSAATAIDEFDYGALDAHGREIARAAAERIRVNIQRTTEQIVEIGWDLLSVKELLGHGKFLNWIASEFRMSDQTARNFMNVASRFGDQIPNGLEFQPSVLYALAAPSTSDEVVNAIAERVRFGELVTRDDVKAAKRWWAAELARLPNLVQTGVLVSDAANIVNDDSPCDDEQTIWRRGMLARANNAIEGATYEDWSHLSVDTQVVQAVRRAAEDWAKLARYIEGLAANKAAAAGKEPGTEVVDTDVNNNAEPAPKRGNRKTADHCEDIHSAIASAFGELVGLAEELEGIVDNAPDGLRESPRNQTLAETIDLLQGMQEPNVPTVLADIKVTYHAALPRRGRTAIARNSSCQRVCGHRSVLGSFRSHCRTGRAPPRCC